MYKIFCIILCRRKLCRKIIQNIVHDKNCLRYYTDFCVQLSAECCVQLCRILCIKSCNYGDPTPLKSKFYESSQKTRKKSFLSLHPHHHRRRRRSFFLLHSIDRLLFNFLARGPHSKVRRNFCG